MAFIAPRHWQDWTNVALGVWMFLSPPILGMNPGGSFAAPAAVVFGLAILALSCMAVYMPRAWEEGLNILLGAGLAVSPWMLGYANESTPTANAAIVGLLVTILAVWAMLANTDVQKWWHDRRLHH